MTTMTTTKFEASFVPLIFQGENKYIYNVINTQLSFEYNNKSGYFKVLFGGKVERAIQLNLFLKFEEFKKLCKAEHLRMLEQINIVLN